MGCRLPALSSLEGAGPLTALRPTQPPLAGAPLGKAEETVHCLWGEAVFTHQDFGGPVWPLPVQTCTRDPLGRESPAWTSPVLPPARCFLPDWLTLFLSLLHSGPAVGAALLLGLQIPGEGKASCPTLSGGRAGRRTGEQ